MTKPVSSPGCEAVMDWADVIVAAGPVFSDYTTAGWTGEPPAGKMINVSARDVRLTAAEYTDVAMADFLAGLAENVHGNDATLTEFRRIATAPAELAARNGDASAQLTRAELWHQIEQDLDPASTLLCEGGDSWFSGAFIRLPGGARFEIEMQWGSLGWACPASFGYAMGLEAGLRLGPGHRRRLVPDDRPGSGQHDPLRPGDRHLPGQQPRLRLESAIHDGPYNYFKNWDYAGLIDALNADDGHGLGLTATTGGRTGRRDQQSTPAQGRPGADRMPDRARRLQHPAHRNGESRPRQHPTAPDHLIHKVMSPRFPGPSGAFHSWRTATAPVTTVRPRLRGLAPLPAVPWTAQGWPGWRVCPAGAGSAAGRTRTARCRRYRRESRPPLGDQGAAGERRGCA